MRVLRRGDEAYDFGAGIKEARSAGPFFLLAFSKNARRAAMGLMDTFSFSLAMEPESTVAIAIPSFFFMVEDEETTGVIIIGHWDDDGFAVFDIATETRIVKNANTSDCCCQSSLDERAG